MSTLSKHQLHKKNPPSEEDKLKREGWRLEFMPAPSMNHMKKKDPPLLGGKWTGMGTACGLHTAPLPLCHCKHNPSQWGGNQFEQGQHVGFMPAPVNDAVGRNQGGTYVPPCPLIIVKNSWGQQQGVLLPSTLPSPLPADKKSGEWRWASHYHPPQIGRASCRERVFALV